MCIKKIFLLLALPLLCSVLVFGQNSSKTKSKSKLRERDVENRDVRVENVTGVNSPNTDFSPSYYKNGIVFVSSRKKDGVKDKNTKETYRELYFAPFDPNGRPATPQSFSLEINGSLNEGPVTFSKDHKTMFFTRNNMVKGVPKADRNGVVHMKIYEADKGPIDWMGVRELPFNSVNYTCFHPSLSMDEKKLYFSSNMPGGYGGYDLYVSERDANGGWATPRNLGGQINTDSNEVYPFIHPSGVLFFTSSGHNSLGGLDNFFVDLGETDDMVIENLGPPFNTEFDDFGVITNSESSQGFFTSNRKEQNVGKDDIYQFAVENGVKGVRKPISQQITLQVVDAKTGERIPDASFWIFDPTNDGFYSGKQDLYKMEMRPLNNKSNTMTFDLVRKSATELGDPDDVTNAAGEKPINLVEYRSYLIVAYKDGYKSGEKFYAIDPERLGSNPTVTVALQSIPVFIPINGTVATDQFGTRIANVTVRLTHKATGRQVVAHTNLNGEYETMLPMEGEYLVNIEKEGFEPENSTITGEQKRPVYEEFRLKPTAVSAGSKVPEELIAPVSVGTVITIDKIYYEYNKSTLTESATRYLDAIAEMMLRYPDMEIDLVSHTDTRGDAKANLALSIDRATNAKNYLVHLGVEAKRIISIGKGESEPRNHCLDGVSCGEQEHQFNRRTEILIRKSSDKVKVEYKSH